MWETRTVGLVGATVVLGYGLIAEEVFTVQTTAQLLQKTKDVVYTVHHGKAEEVLLPVECSWRGKSSDPLESQYALTNEAHNFVCFVFGKEVNVKSCRATPECRLCTTPDIFSPP